MRFEGARKSAVEAWEGFIGAGVGNDTGSAWRDARHAGAGVGRALVSSGRVEHVVVFICSSSCTCRAPKRVNLANCLVQDFFLAPRAS